MPVAAAYSTQAAHSGAAFRASFLAAFFAALCAAPADRARLTAPSVPAARPAARLRRLLRRPLPREVLAELHKSLPRVGRLPHWASLCAEQPVARPFVRIQVPQPAYSHPADSERDEGGASHATARPAPVLMRQREPDVWLRLSQASARRCGGSKRGRVSAQRCGLLWTPSPYTRPAPARWGGRRASPAPRRGSRRHSARSRTRGRCEARSSSYVR